MSSMSSQSSYFSSMPILNLVVTYAQPLAQALGESLLPNDFFNQTQEDKQPTSLENRVSSTSVDKPIPQPAPQNPVSSSSNPLHQDKQQGAKDTGLPPVTVQSAALPTAAALAAAAVLETPQNDKKKNSDSSCGSSFNCFDCCTCCCYTSCKVADCWSNLTFSALLTQDAQNRGGTAGEAEGVYANGFGYLCCPGAYNDQADCVIKVNKICIDFFCGCGGDCLNDCSNLDCSGCDINL